MYVLCVCSYVYVHVYLGTAMRNIGDSQGILSTLGLAPGTATGPYTPSNPSTPRGFFV